MLPRHSVTCHLSPVTRPEVAIVLSQFPRYDEAFLLRELVALEQEGVPFVLYSLKACHDRVVHDDAARLAQRTVYAPLSSPAVWAVLARQIVAAPIATASVIGRLVRYFWRHPVVLAKSLVVLAKAIYFGRLARERGVRIVHAGWATYPATAAWAMQRLYGLPYGFAGHAHDIYLDTTMLAEKIRTARWVVTCTEENARYLARLANGGSARIVVNHHGLDLGRFADDGEQGAQKEGGSKKEEGGSVPLSSLFPLPSSLPVVLSVGSLLPCKGFEKLIEACRLLRERGVAFRCVVAGGGPLEADLRRRIARAGLVERVTLLGYVSQEALVPWYRRASVFALAAVGGIHWGIPNVVVEALAVGVPVICTKLPAIRELLGQAADCGMRIAECGLENVNPKSEIRNLQLAGLYEVAEAGLIVPDRDATALAAAIERLLRDRPLAERLVAVGRERVRREWDIRVTGRQLAALLQE